MLSEEYYQIGQRELDVEALKATKAVRNFLCDYLYKDNLLISYAPASEFGASSTYRYLFGGHVCEHDEERNTILPMASINYRVIKELFACGLIRVKKNIRSPTPRCAVFEWSHRVKAKRRQILKEKIFANAQIKSSIVDAVAAQYGVKVRFVNRRGVFEIVSANLEPLSRDNARNWYILTDSQGEPVGGYRDLSFDDWEQYIFEAATKHKTKKHPLPIPSGSLSHFSRFKRG